MCHSQSKTEKAIANVEIVLFCEGLGMRLSEEPDATPRLIVQEWLQAPSIYSISS
jgi:hypothetical protein